MTTTPATPNDTAAGAPASPADSSRPDATIALDGVSVFYGEVVGLSSVTLSIGPGITGIVGPNGSGKTTLMRVLTGLLQPREGTVAVLGQPPFHDAATRARTSFVPAVESFFENVSARRNAEIAFLARGRSGAAARKKAEEALAVAGLADEAHRRYGAWSRGMRQRLKLGLALAADVDIVLLDEPFLGVDPPTRTKLRGLILDLSQKGRTVLVASHVLSEIESLTDTVGILASGRLLGHGRVDTLLRELRDRHPHRIQLEADNPRRLAEALVALDHVNELKLGTDGELEFVSARPDAAYRALADAIVATDVVVRRVTTRDNSLEALFEKVTEAGARRL